MSFVHLHTHSHYSLLDGLSKIPDLVKKAKEQKMPALSLTDHGAMYGAIEFYKTCKKEGIKPIIGFEAYVARRTRHDRSPEFDTKSYHLTLIAKNEKGYKNLMKLTSIAHIEGFYYKPRIDKELLEKYSEGIICLSGCPGSEFVQLIKNDRIDDAKELLKFYEKCFGRENLFVEVMKHEEVDWYMPLVEKIVSIAKEVDLPIVGTWDSHYLHKEDGEAHDTLVAINTGSEVGEAKMSMKDGDYSLIGPSEAKEVFGDIEGAVENTLKIADMVDIEIDIGNLYFPIFETEKGKSPDEVLKDRCYSLVESVGLKKDDEVVKRLEYELGIIKDKGYSSYFLIVADLMRFAKENGIYTNTRGSAAGSLVSYVCGITNVDPLFYNLPFERFLNPFRPSAPDIDLDIADNRRDEMIEYAKQKYGENKVAQIGTFGTMMARGAVRDVARALGYPYNTGDVISKMIPMGSQGFPMTIDHAMELVPELKEMYETDRDAKIILDMAKKIEGSARHISVHAAGVVISPGELTDYTPVQLDPKGGKLITQYNMHAVEDVGLVKFDFLGIRNLAFLADSIKLVEKIYEEKIDINKIPLDDKKTFEMLARGETEGVFQLNGAGMTQKLIKLKPTSIHDLNVMVALYRPGPMQTIDEYIERKHGKKPITFYHPKMKNFLAPSLGLLVYQDDLLFTALELSGYDWGEVDKFRKAVGKKIPEEMAKQHVRFVEGCIKYSGMSKKEAEKIWDLFEPFQGYGFNKAHAASYGKVAYETAYMKANYPVPYMTAILTAESGDIDKISPILAECKRMKINVLPPSINDSFGGFTVVSENGEDLKESRAIRFGLYTIKNLGTDISDAIIEERKKGGKFSSIGEFLTRINHRNLNKKSLEALIKSGAMDVFGYRGELLENMGNMLLFIKEGNSNKNQASLFGETSEINEFKLTPGNRADIKDKLIWEKELLGVYVSGHPLDKYEERIKQKNAKTIEEITSNKIAQKYLVACMVSDIKVHYTKTNSKMAFVKLEDKTGTIEGVIFPDALNKAGSNLEKGQIIAAYVTLKEKNGEKNLIVDDLKLLE